MYDYDLHARLASKCKNNRSMIKDRGGRHAKMPIVVIIS
jgi:hypothetical protein